MEKILIGLFLAVLAINPLLSQKAELDKKPFPAPEIGSGLLASGANGAEKIFLSDSRLRANPLDDPNGLFSFDYYIEMEAKWGADTHVIHYYVNSKDGSLGFAADALPGMDFSSSNPGDSLHFLVIFPGVATIMYGLQKGKKMAMKVEGDNAKTQRQQYQDNYLTAMDFLNSIKFTTQEYREINDPVWHDRVYSLNGTLNTDYGTSPVALSSINIQPW